MNSFIKAILIFVSIAAFGGLIGVLIGTYFPQFLNGWGAPLTVLLFVVISFLILISSNRKDGGKN